MIRIEVELEEWEGSPVIRDVTTAYARWRAENYRDLPADLTPRQAVFYRNLIRLAEALGRRDIPVDFSLSDRRRVYLDHGCIKIAERAGFIEPLRNGSSGLVEVVHLAWHVSRND